MSHRQHEHGPELEQMRQLMDAIYEQYSYDFRDYSVASLWRRVKRAVEGLHVDGIPALQKLVVRDSAAFMQLLQMLTIPVTQMFRDPEFFAALREQVVPVLKTYPSPKIWVAGCSSGEEALSLAILLKEEGLLERSTIYATDINPQILDKARKGVFALEKMALYSSNYQQAGGLSALSDYYRVVHETVQFDPTLSSNIIFADHSLATDSVFAETQLVCCRNVLIYFKRSLQDRALGLFRESLCHRGFLGLGSKESANFSAHAASFEALGNDKLHQKLYRKRSV
ncbi:CheR family methyltransferase [Janthinobacterium agaricidamnosum]|uniref:CheR methyltransferase, SAM binding domain protein n=1 Tax=Janthinobacterium agaricidamnosum NBRC 102515 = DSM 9628 TaxID=1349767 RepID=W0V2N9_9BURK|nr:CheR family methyltransferase [Janthinobacterium agaricidamnosum]CDG83089.1 cheR methyltransferase, SAM binding domain protein [Janthinobacterium agaricidamnosum NBRC 102515 = DSM 9628]